MSPNLDMVEIVDRLKLVMTRLKLDKTPWAISAGMTGNALKNLLDRHEKGDLKDTSPKLSSFLALCAVAKIPAWIFLYPNRQMLAVWINRLSLVEGRAVPERREDDALQAILLMMMEEQRRVNQALTDELKKLRESVDAQTRAAEYAGGRLDDIGKAVEATTKEKAQLA